MNALRTLAIIVFVSASLLAVAAAKADDAVPVYLTLGNGAVFSGTLTFSNNSFTDLTAVDATLTDYELGHKGYVGPPNIDDIDFVTDAGSPALIGGGTIFRVADNDTLLGLLTRNTITLQLNTSNDPPTIVDDFVITLPRGGTETIYLTGANIVANDVSPSGQQDNAPNGAPIAPEPGSGLLLGTGLAGLAVLLMRRAARTA
jgi:hypothetical protein